MNNKSELISLDKAITAAEREAAEYKGRRRGEAAAADHWTLSGSKEKWIEMCKRVEALKAKREELLLS